MTLYKYQFRYRNPELFERCIFSSSQVPVEYNGISRGAANVNNSGEILLDLPDEAIQKIEHGTARVDLNHLTDNGADGRAIAQIFSIEIFDLS